MNLLIVGPPGSGKGTQSLRISRALGIPHVSTCALLHTRSGSERLWATAPASVSRRGISYPMHWSTSSCENDSDTAPPEREAS